MLYSKRFARFLTAAAGMSVAAAAVQAQNVIYVDDDAPAGGGGASWATAYVDLQDALAAASAGGASEIRVAQGTYKPAGPGGSREATFQLINGVALRGGYAGLGAPDPNDRNVTAYETILSGDLVGSANSFHVVTGSGTYPTAILDGFTVTGGNANQIPMGYGAGGAGMLNENGSPTVINCTFRENQAILCGAGMLNYEDSNPAVIGCVFLRNSGPLEGGGTGMANIDYCAPLLVNCSFIQNTAALDGAGMTNMTQSNPLLVNCVFLGNTIPSEDGVGGAMFNGDESSPTLVNCAFAGNMAGGQGVLFGGGGMYNDVRCIPVLTNCTFSGNWAARFGGGIYNVTTSPLLTNCILWGNSDQGGSNTDDSAQVYNDHIFEEHHGWQAAEITYGCIQDSDPDDGWVYPGVGNIDDDPLFVRMPDDGGDGWGVGDNDDFGNLHVRSGSPCIDAADNTAVPPTITTDLDGSPRFLDDPATPDTGNGTPPIVDMGPYEYAWDCNNNGIDDAEDIANGTSPDADSDGIPDECEECLDDMDCDDGLFCNGDELCVTGMCFWGTAPCAAQFCDEVIDVCESCVTNAECDDGLFCNGSEQCVGGLCFEGPLPCPAHLCNEEAEACDGCVATSDCDDGLFCNGPEECTSGSCAAGNAPCLAALCDESADACLECQTDYDCDDELFCNGSEQCVTGRCVLGEAPCTEVPCDETLDACLECQMDYHCDDRLFCNGREFCVGGLCVPGSTPCPADYCLEGVDVCLECLTAAECDDGDPCTLEDCVSGTCEFTPDPECNQGAGAPGRADEDNDGVADSDDECPNTRPGQSVDGKGCSCRESDDDGDGVNNCADVCPDTEPGDVVYADGCSEAQLDGGDGELPDDTDDQVVDGDDALEDLEDGSADHEESPESPTGAVPDDPGDLPAGSAEGDQESAAEDHGEPDAGSSQPPSSEVGRRSGSIGSRGACGALGLIHLAFLLSGLPAMRAIQQRGRRSAPRR
ncbi:MAG: right-handed parallel beta-helix repeat-containing protein [Planctomycetota bacterium]